jgi:hypothetical protein
MEFVAGYDSLVISSELLDFEVLGAVVKNGQIFWVVEPYRPFVNRRFGGKYRLLLQGRKRPSK